MTAFQTLHRVLSLLLLATLLAACFPKNGRPYLASPAELLDDAREACERRDTQAHQMLLERLIRKYPDSDEASFAKHRLEKERTTGESCS